MRKTGTFIFIIIIISVFLYLIVDPKYKEYKVLKAQEQENQKTLALIKDLKQERNNLESKYKAISVEERIKLEKVLPDTVDNVRLLVDIKEIAKKKNILIKSIDVSGGPTSDSKNTKQNTVAVQKGPARYGTLTIAFSFSASYKTFIDFMNELERSLRLVDIRDVSVSAGNSDIYNYSLKVETYWLR